MSCSVELPEGRVLGPASMNKLGKPFTLTPCPGARSSPNTCRTKWHWSLRQKNHTLTPCMLRRHLCFANPHVGLCSAVHGLPQEPRGLAPGNPFARMTTSTSWFSPAASTIVLFFWSIHSKDAVAADDSEFWTVGRFKIAVVHHGPLGAKLVCRNEKILIHRVCCRHHKRLHTLRSGALQVLSPTAMPKHEKPGVELDRCVEAPRVHR